MPREPYPVPTPPECRESMGLSPAALANRDYAKKPYTWCPKPQNIEYDRWCDPDRPKAINYRQVFKASEVLREFFPMTPLRKSKHCDKFGLELYYKIETGHLSGSFHERSAIYALTMLTDMQRYDGVWTASTGNWALALAYQACQQRIRVTVVLPLHTATDVVDKLKYFGATVILHGNTLGEAKKKAFILLNEHGRGSYLNGYDHPHVIAGAGSIGIEILEQLPNVDAILIPIGGGSLIAGISTVIKHKKPAIKIYGIEPAKSYCFFKAMYNESPYKIETEKCIGLTATLAAPRAGENAFHTAQSLIDKMVLVNDDWTTRAVLHLAEEEKLIVEGAGAISLGTLMSMPNIVPELHGKRVVCILSGGNESMVPYTRILTRGKLLDGRYVTVTVRLGIENPAELIKLLKIIANLGCSIIQKQTEHNWVLEDMLLDDYVTFQIETKNIKHARTLKHVLEKLFPNQCEFKEDAFIPIPICSCFPKKSA